MQKCELRLAQMTLLEASNIEVQPAGAASPMTSIRGRLLTAHHIPFRKTNDADRAQSLAVLARNAPRVQ
jgi:hypothetical protein